MDRHRARTCPSGGDAGGHHLPTALLLAALVVIAQVCTAAPTSAAPVPDANHAVSSASTATLTLLSQTAWVTPGQTFDLRLHAGSADPAASLGLTVSIYPCLSTLSGFDQSLNAASLGSPVSQTTTAIPLQSLPAVNNGGVELALPVVVGNNGTSAATSATPFTIHLLAVEEQCQSFPAGVFPVRIQLVDLASSAVRASFVTHLVTTVTQTRTQRLQVSVVLPIQLTVGASRSPSPAELLIHPSAALATPSDAAVAAVTGTVEKIAVEHPSVPVTLQVSGQTVGLLDTPAHRSTITQLGQLAATPSVHQVTAAPFTPVDATGLVDTGLDAELGLQVARGTESVTLATGHLPPDPTEGLGPWITGDGVDAPTVTALDTYGFRQLVLPASQLSSAPSDGSTTSPFLLGGTNGAQLVAMASDDDLTARFSGDPGNPVLAAHQLAAELAQLYYERPNDVAPRAVMAVAPSSWSDDPAFVDALLGALTGNPVVDPVTTSQLFALFPTPATCRTGCRAVPTGTSVPPVAAVRIQRGRVNGFAAAAIGGHALAQALGDLVLGGEAETLRTAQQSAVLANAGAAVDTQIAQVAVAGDRSVTLTASSGKVPVTVVSNASFPVAASLVLSSDKLLFQNGASTFSTPRTLLPHHTNVFYIPVQTRATGVFRMDIVLHAPGSPLRLATGELSVRSTASSVVGVLLTVGAVVVLAVWWIRTSLRRRTARRAEDDAIAAGAPPGGGTP